jgi:hypothetical protein
MGVHGQLHDPAALPPGQGPLAPTEYDAGLDPEPVWTRWRREKFPAPAGTRTPDHPVTKMKPFPNYLRPEML